VLSPDGCRSGRTKSLAIMIIRSRRSLWVRTETFLSREIFVRRIDIQGQQVTSQGTVNNDVFLAKFNLDGNKIWLRRMGGSDDEVVRSISADRNGDVILTGSFTGSASFEGGR